MKNQKILKEKHLNSMHTKSIYFSSNNINQNKIFKNLFNRKLKQTPFNKKISDIGKTKYLPPVFKEWKNTVYSFYKNKTKDMPINNININKIIRFYFNLYFKDRKFISLNKFVLKKFSKFSLKKITLKNRRSFLKQIHLSKAEIKHTNDKAIITLYVINLEKNVLYKKYDKWIVNYLQKIINYLDYKFKTKIFENLFLNKFILNNYFLIKKKEYIKFKYKFFDKFKKFYILFLKAYLIKLIKFSLYKNLIFIKKYQYIYYLNKYKFERNFFLHKLSNLLSKILKKKIEYNIINLKSFAYNTDIFTNVLALKLKKRRKKISVMRGINSVLNRAKLPNVNRIIEKAKVKNWSFLDNKYKNLNLISNLKNWNFNKFLNKLYLSKRENLKVYNIIFNSIKYKNMGGIRLEVRGRLTKRYRADRAIYKLKWKGGLKNIDSSFKGLSSVLLRGYLNPNVNYSIFKSKRRIGAFSVKGWISGK